MYLKTATAGGNNTNDWLIVLDGGGICTHKDDCTARANTSLGSSKFFPPTFNFSSIAFTSDDAKNPFQHWNLIFVPYCDGGLHSGQKTVADESTYNLYFSGHHTIDATIQYLSAAHNMNTSESVVVFSGGSAGGVGAFNNLDFVVRSLPDAKVLGAPVGGFPPTVHFFPGVAPPAEALRDIDFARIVPLFDSYMNAACVKAHAASDAYTCLIPYKMYQYLETPVFISEASNPAQHTAHHTTQHTTSQRSAAQHSAAPLTLFSPLLSSVTPPVLLCRLPPRSRCPGAGGVSCAACQRTQGCSPRQGVASYPRRMLQNLRIERCASPVQRAANPLK